MRAWIIQSLLRLRASYYFIPALMCLGAIGLGFATVAIDLEYQPEIREILGWFYASTVDNARSLLTTIAGSMISVAAVTFSLTMVAVTTAAGQYGPRLIGNFMRDRSNQITLGMFLSTFLFCIFVLRSVSGAGEEAAGLIPSVSVLVALLLTLISVGVLIYFIHHIPETLNVGTMTGKVARTLLREIQTNRFPEADDIVTGDCSRLGDPFDPAITQTVHSDTSGYVEAVSLKRLLDWSVKTGSRVKLLCVPGDFIMKGDPVMAVVPDNPARPVDPDAAAVSLKSALGGFLALGRERTVYQNLLFPADELVEITARALSPGVNDPFTAVNCVHWFGDVCLAMIETPPTPECVLDPEGSPRIWTRTVTFQQFCDTLFGKSRQYVCEDETVAREALTVLYHIRERADVPSGAVIDRQIGALHEAIEQGGLGEAQKARLRGGPPYSL